MDEEVWRVEGSLEFREYEGICGRWPIIGLDEEILVAAVRLQ